MDAHPDQLAAGIGKLWCQTAAARRHQRRPAGLLQRARDVDGRALRAACVQLRHDLQDYGRGWLNGAGATMVDYVGIESQGDDTM